MSEKERVLDAPIVIFGKSGKGEMTMSTISVSSMKSSATAVISLHTLLVVVREPAVKTYSLELKVKSPVSALSPLLTCLLSGANIHVKYTITKCTELMHYNEAINIPDIIIIESITCHILYLYHDYCCKVKGKAVSISTSKFQADTGNSAFRYNSRIW